MNEQNNQTPELNPASPLKGAARRPAKNHRRYPFELKLRAVKLHIEEGFSGSLIAQETGVSQQALSGWIKLYRQFGEEGLKAHTPPAQRAAKLPSAVTAKILELKQANPTFGVKRISQWLRRVFFLKASPETVRQR